MEASGAEKMGTESEQQGHRHRGRGDTFATFFHCVASFSMTLAEATQRRREMYPQIQGLMGGGGETATQPVALNGHTPVLLFIQPRKSPNPYFV